jgi:hypothetical protein
MASDADEVLRKIQALVDKAHSTTFDAEAKALIAKAEELMLRYSLDPQMVLDPNRPNTARPVYDSKPIRRDITILQDTGEGDHQMIIALHQLFSAVCRHLFIRTGHGAGWGERIVIGYPVDINFMEMYFLKLKLHLFSNLIFDVDHNKDWVQVIAGLRLMGFSWEQIHYKMYDSGHPGYPYRDERYWERRMGVNFTGKVKTFCERTGFPRNKATNAQAWRTDFVNGYVHEITTRLAAMRREVLDSSPNLPALAADKTSAVDEAYYEEFPELRPHPEDCQCEMCHYMRCHDLNCMRPKCVAGRKPVRERKVYYRNLHTDAYQGGRAVGRTADLTDKGPIG